MQFGDGYYDPVDVELRVTLRNVYWGGIRFLRPMVGTTRGDHVQDEEIQQFTEIISDMFLSCNNLCTIKLLLDKWKLSIWDYRLLKRPYTFTRLHDTTPQKTAIFSRENNSKALDLQCSAYCMNHSSDPAVSSGTYVVLICCNDWPNESVEVGKLPNRPV